MSGSITVLKTYPTVDIFAADSPARGMSFKSPSDGNIYLAVVNTTFLALNKATGAQVFATDANNLQFKTVWNPGAGNFLNAAAGGAFNNHSVSVFDGAGTFLTKPLTGANCYGSIIAAGNYFGGDTGDQFVTVLNAATGAPVVQIDTTVSAPTTGVGQWANDGVSIWCTGINSFLIQIDPVGLTLVNAFDMTGLGVGRFAGIVFVGGFLYLTDRFTGTVWKFDLLGNLISSKPIGLAGYLTFDGTWFWLLDVFFSPGLVAVYDAAFNLQASFVLPGSAQDIANDAAEGPGFAWVTSGGPPSQVQRLQFIPLVPPSTSAFPGTFAGFTTPGQFGGGTK